MLCKDHYLFLFRFKAEVAKALESFVEKEDEFIKEVIQKSWCCHLSHVYNITICRVQLEG